MHAAAPPPQMCVIGQATADAAGESINGYVNGAVLARMGLGEWPSAPTVVEE